jgi:hypothetical protein
VTRHALKSIVASSAFWTQWVALELLGPARLTDDQDPVEMLKRRYHRHLPREHPLWSSKGYKALSHLPD